MCQFSAVQPHRWWLEHLVGTGKTAGGLAASGGHAWAWQPRAAAAAMGRGGLCGAADTAAAEAHFSPRFLPLLFFALLLPILQQDLRAQKPSSPHFRHPNSAFTSVCPAADTARPWAPSPFWYRRQMLPALVRSLEPTLLSDSKEVLNRLRSEAQRSRGGSILECSQMPTQTLSHSPQQDRVKNRIKKAYGSW